MTPGGILAVLLDEAEARQETPFPRSWDFSAVDSDDGEWDDLG